LPNRLKAWPWFLLALAVVALDQYSKGLATQYLDYARPVRLLAWFDLTLHHNTGAAFSFLRDAGGWQRWMFTGIAVVVSGALSAWLYRAPRGQWLLGLALGLILGGAMGNLWDRLAQGYVVDFISWHWQDWYFPTFNLADSAITAGAACMVLDSFVQWRRERQ